MRGEKKIKLLFLKKAPIVSRVLIFGFLALLLIGLDAKTDFLKPLRYQLTTLSTPLHWLVSLPRRVGDWSDNALSVRQELEAENTILRTENFVLQQKLQKMATLVADNIRLNELLNASENIDSEVLSAKLIGVSPDPRRHEIVLDKGSEHGVYLGQAVLDADGLVGLVIEVTKKISRILLIIDQSNAVPVQILRTDARAIVEGVGSIL